ncbi:MAG: hypothetical protein LBV52_05620 [Spirochaetaceae bacterium]|jgi:hypothetical protein|nr:hypothetical protein [Spirochaetaceae bacterium]
MTENCRKGILCRSIAIFAILYQIQLIARDISEIPVFVAALCIAFFSAFVLLKERTNPLASIIIIIFIPVLARIFISIPRFFLDETNTALIIKADTLLLDFDRNNFVNLLPFYWVALSTLFSCKMRRFLRFSIVVDCILLTIMFTLTSSVSIEIYRLPLVKIVVFIFIFLFEIFAALFSSPPDLKPVRKEFAVAIIFIILLGGITGTLLMRPMQESALEMNSGLIQPKLFDFDFAPYLRLENEIQTNDDLVFIVQKDISYLDQDIGMNGDDLEETFGVFDDHYLMRRYVLSAYNSGTEKDKSIGFFRNDQIDETSQSFLLPRGSKTYNIDGLKARSRLDQEYYLVNLDPSAFIAMNEIQTVTPYESWDASSFKSAYAVSSMVSYAYPMELINSVKFDFNDDFLKSEAAAALELTDEEYDYYTLFSFKGKQTERELRITELTKEITSSTTNYWKKIQIVYEYLKFGEYRYSLKPGIAADGDQLTYFIFDSKKGYCSYFAFAFSAMLRSIGIPCRVAVGFSLDQSEEKLGFYPVRASMAHAWVEVWFPSFGWREYDPTTRRSDEMMDGGNSGDLPPDVFQKLLKEILENHNKLQASKDLTKETELDLSSKQNALKIIKTYAFPSFLFLIIICCLLFRFRFSIKAALTKNTRRKTVFLWSSLKQKLYYMGYKNEKSISESEWVHKIDQVLSNNNDNILTNLYQCVQTAKYSENYTQEDFEQSVLSYKDFTNWYKKNVPLLRRILICAFAPLSLLLTPKNKTKIVPFLLLLSLLLFTVSDSTRAQSTEFNRDTLFNSAQTAEKNEYWEKAIELYLQGKNNFPYDVRFPMSLADLYFSKELFNLALDEYLYCLNFMPSDKYILFHLAQTYGSLNEYAFSARFYEKLLALDPNETEAIENLAWVYFKLHRLTESETLLIEAMNKFGRRPDFCMTLATVYSDMFDYDKSKQYYLESIKNSMITMRTSAANEFSALAYYNLSILESNFYHFGEALDSTINSLLNSDKSSGHLARGELNLRRLDFKEALKDYEKSYKMDTSPLSKLSMAIAYQRAGRLTESLLLAQDCLKQKNHSWMINFGMDLDSYKRTLYKIIYESYEGLEKAENFYVTSSIGDLYNSLKSKIKFAFHAKINKLLYQKYCSVSANSMFKDKTSEEQILEALKYYYFAFNDYKGRARYYLRTAKNIEVNLIPKSLSSYLFEEGRLDASQALLDDSLEGFDPVWEQDMISDAYTELSLIAKKHNKKDMLNEYTGKVYAMNAGALRQNGLRLPVNLILNSVNPAAEKQIVKFVNKSGFNTGANDDNRFDLHIDIKSDEVYFRIYDRGRGVSVLNKTYPLKSTQKKDIATLINIFASDAFTAR